MGALYEDVENFFGDIFAVYGRFLARYPVVFILLSLLTSALLGMGLLSLQYETNVQRLYTPMDSQAAKDQAHLLTLFPDRTSKAFYQHQLLQGGTYGEVFVTSKDEGENVLVPKIIDEILMLYDTVTRITLEKDDRGHTYTDLCAVSHDRCVVNGYLFLSHLAKNPCLNMSSNWPVVHDTLQDDENIRYLVSGVGQEDGCMTAKAISLRFNLRHDSARQRKLSILWEEKFLECLATYPSTNLKVYYSTSESLDIELSDHVGQDTNFFALTIVIMILYAAFVSSGGNWVSTRMFLALTGIVAALLAILASFGLLSLCGMRFVDTCGVMPFLVLGVGVDDMFILMSGWRQTDIKQDIETRVANTFRSSAISVTITSLTDLLAFSIGATSPFLSVRNFCVYTGVAILLCYFNQLTFFGGCLVLHARRVLSSRHCVTCLKTSSRAELKEEGASKMYILLCSGHPPKKCGEDDSPCEKLPSTFLPRLLLADPTKAFIIIGFIVYIGISIWGAAQIKTGLKLENVVPESSYLSSYNSAKQQYFADQGPYVMFIVVEEVDYTDPLVINEIHRILLMAQETKFLDTSFQISWLDQFMAHRKNYTEQVTKENFVQLTKEFVNRRPDLENDICFNKAGTGVQASRFYVHSYRFPDSNQEGNMMLKMRKIAKNSTLPMVVFSTEFIYYEHYVSILKNTLLAVGVAIIGMLFVALMFIPHPISVTCVTLTMVTIVLGMFGFMHFWGLALSAITTVQIILSVGFCVDFTVHISHAFMTATGKNRNERVMSALEKVGIPILNGAISSILGILMLAFAGSYIYKSFFKTMLLVILLGLAHSVLLLPVLLSFIGPRRTSKPKVFIPISLSTYHPKPPSEHHKEAPHDSAPQSHLGDDGHEEMELMQLAPDEDQYLSASSDVDLDSSSGQDSDIEDSHQAMLHAPPARPEQVPSLVPSHGPYMAHTSYVPAHVPSHAPHVSHAPSHVSHAPHAKSQSHVPHTQPTGPKSHTAYGSHAPQSHTPPSHGSHFPQSHVSHVPQSHVPQTYYAPHSPGVDATYPNDLDPNDLRHPVYPRPVLLHFPEDKENKSKFSPIKEQFYFDDGVRNSHGTNLHSHVPSPTSPQELRNSIHVETPSPPHIRLSPLKLSDANHTVYDS